MKFGLKENIIEKINKIFSEYSKIEKVYIYGSRAKGNYRNGSDIDISMVGKGLKYNDQLDIYDKIDDLLLPYMVDLSIYDQIDNQNLTDHIDRVGKVFYEKDEG